MTKPTLLQTGTWDDNLTWELYETTELPPTALCTAVMCVAIAEGKVVLARSERGWGLLGGHIETGESLETALEREALEEGGFTVERRQLFAVRKITARRPVAHGRDIQAYPFPVSYIVYYLATTTQPLVAPTGEEILESGSFALDEVPDLKTRDQLVIKAGWALL